MKGKWANYWKRIQNNDSKDDKKKKKPWKRIEKNDSKNDQKPWKQNGENARINLKRPIRIKE